MKPKWEISVESYQGASRLLPQRNFIVTTTILVSLLLLLWNALPCYSTTIYVDDDSPGGGRVWDANDPFSQPVATSDYYGSGDIDLDGRLTEADLIAADEMDSGARTSCIRADVDGDGDVDFEDVSLIRMCIESGDVLPAWWNRLQTREAREDWVRKFIAIDTTDTGFYIRDEWVCMQFALQTLINGGCYGGDLFPLAYTGGQTVFNLPVYLVGVPGHEINAILVGDDPSNFWDWFFFEPQVDNQIRPGEWDMPWGCTVQIAGVRYIGESGRDLCPDRVVFYIDKNGPQLVSIAPEVRKTRPVQSPLSLQNQPDIWNPRMLPADEGLLLFECRRDDMSRAQDIHLGESPLTAPTVGSPLMKTPAERRLLDMVRGDSGTVHLLWNQAEGLPSHEWMLYHGELDLGTKQLSQVTSASVGRTALGRITLTGNGEIHVFWLVRDGIKWTRCVDEQWQPSQYIVQEEFEYSTWWSDRDLHRYRFDVASLQNGDIVLVWARQPWTNLPHVASCIRYDAQMHGGSWCDATTVAGTSLVKAVDLQTDSSGTLHLVCLVDVPSDDNIAAGRHERGNLIHLTSTDGGDHWSIPVQIDGSDRASCPQMAASTAGEVFLTWERRVESPSEKSQVVPVLRCWKASSWSQEQMFPIPAGSHTWYPTVACLSGSTPIIVWSSRTAYSVDIGTLAVDACPEPDPAIVGGHHTLTVSSSAGGLVTHPGEGQFEYTTGGPVSIEALALTGYHFFTWTGTAVDAGKVADPYAATTTVFVDGDYTLRATFDTLKVTTPVVAWEKTFGGTKRDRASKVQATRDGGCIVVGDSESYTNGGVDAYLIKLDSNGTVQWQMNCGAGADDYGYAVQQTPDGGYLVTGQADSSRSVGGDAFLARIRTDGTLEWFKKYPKTGGQVILDLKPTSDGAYVMFGHTTTSDTVGQDFYLMKVDAKGTILWERTYGGAYCDVPNMVEVTRDGGFIMVGTSWYTPYWDWFTDAYVVWVDYNGNLLRERWYGDGVAGDYANSISRVGSNGYIIVGSSGYAVPGFGGPASPDTYLLRIAENGDILWEKRFGGPDQDIARSVIHTSDGMFMIAGETWSKGQGANDVQIVMTTESGDVRWEATYGTPGLDRAFSICEVAPGEYVACGEKNWDAYVIKLRRSPSG